MGPQCLLGVRPRPVKSQLRTSPMNGGFPKDHLLWPKTASGHQPPSVCDHFSNCSNSFDPLSVRSHPRAIELITTVPQNAT